MVKNSSSTVSGSDAKPQLVSSHRNKMIAFRAKYEGRGYKQVADWLNVPVSTLTTYFSREWKEDYEEFAEQETTFRLEQARNVVRKHINRAALELTGLTYSKNESVKLGAIKYLLDRTVGESFFSMIDETETMLIEKMSVEKRTKRKAT